LRIDERSALRIEDVRVEDVPWIDRQRARDPGDVPDRQLAVAVVDAADSTGLEGDRVGEDRRQQNRRSDDHRVFAAEALPRRPVAEGGGLMIAGRLPWLRRRRMVNRTASDTRPP